LSGFFISLHTEYIMKHRNRIDIYGCLNLEAANGEQQRVRLSIRAFSYAHAKESINMLLENGLIEYNKNDQILK
jgi:predicted transcriptional regulator